MTCIAREYHPSFLVKVSAVCSELQTQLTSDHSWQWMKCHYFMVHLKAPHSCTQFESTQTARDFMLESQGFYESLYTIFLMWTETIDMRICFGQFYWGPTRQPFYCTSCASEEFSLFWFEGIVLTFLFSKLKHCICIILALHSKLTVYLYELIYIFLSHTLSKVTDEECLHVYAYIFKERIQNQKIKTHPVLHAPIPQNLANCVAYIIL